MPTPSPKPSSPIPFRRNRAQTFDQVWPPSHHPSQGPFLPLQPIAGKQSSPPQPPAEVPEEDKDPFYSNSANNPLQVVDTMRLQVVRDENENTIGMRVIDVNNTYGKGANVYAPLPLGSTATGVAFSVGAPHGMHSAYMRATQITGSERIMGIMFAPPQQQGKVRDVDWSFLEPVKDRDKNPVPNPVTGRFDGMDHTHAQSVYTTQSVSSPESEFGVSSKPKPKTEQTAESDEPEVEDTGIKLHHMIKKMLLEDKGDDD